MISYLQNSNLELQPGFWSYAIHHCRSGQLTQQEGKVQQWRQFTARQAERYVPASAKQTRRILSESASYRLRIQSVSNLPPLSQATYGVTYELQLAVSLFDESLGVFYGNTCYSPSDVPEQQQQPADAADGAVPRVGVDFCFDVFFHSTISDPQCMAVVSVFAVFTGSVIHSMSSSFWCSTQHQTRPSMLVVFRSYHKPEMAIACISNAWRPMYAHHHRDLTSTRPCPCRWK